MARTFLHKQRRQATMDARTFGGCQLVRQADGGLAGFAHAEGFFEANHINCDARRFERQVLNVIVNNHGKSSTTDMLNMMRHYRQYIKEVA